MLSAIIDMVAEEFYLSPVTVAKVLKESEDDAPAHTTIYRQQAPSGSPTGGGKIQPPAFKMAV